MPAINMNIAMTKGITYFFPVSQASWFFFCRFRFSSLVSDGPLFWGLCLRVINELNKIYCLLFGA